MFMLESQKTMKTTMFVINIRRFTCGVRKERVKSFIGNKRCSLSLMIKFEMDNYPFLLVTNSIKNLLLFLQKN